MYILGSCEFVKLAQSVRMNAQNPAERLKYARERAGYKTAKSFADHHLDNANTYYSHESGSRGFHKFAEQYSGLLGNCTAGWLLTGEGVGPDTPKGTAEPCEPVDILNVDKMQDAAKSALIACNGFWGNPAPTNEQIRQFQKTLMDLYRADDTPGLSLVSGD